MSTIILVTIAGILFIELLRVRGLLTAARSKIIDLESQLDDALDDYAALKEQGVLHKPVRIEVVLGNSQYPKGYVFRSTRAALRALGKPTDGKLPKPNERGTIHVGGFILKRLS